MSKKGCSPDNSACEGVFGRLKNEMFYNTDWTGVNLSDFMDILNNYLVWYNETRIKKSLGYMSPMEYRRSLGLVA
jgi:transposase InsO family protein